MSIYSIGIDKINFVCKTICLNGAINDLESPGAQVGHNSASAVMDTYCELYDALSGIISIYKQLLFRDADKVSSVGTAMENTDVLLGQMYG